MSGIFKNPGAYLDYTPVADVAAGDAIKIGTFICVADNDIAANKLGALRTGGVYDMAADIGAFNGVAGDEYDFDFTAQTVVPAGTGDADVRIFLAEDAAAAQTPLRVYLNQFGAG